MRSFASFFAVLVVVACAVTSSGGSPPAMAEDSSSAAELAKRPFPLITVSGTSELAIAPDEAWVHLGVESFFPTMESSVSDNDKRIKALLDTLRQGGIDAADIATTLMSLAETERYEDANRRVRGWQISRSLVARVRHLDRLETLLQALVRAGATHLRDVHFTHSQLAAKKGEARVAATQAARAKAAAMAAAIGQTIGHAVTVREVGQGRRAATFSDYSNAVVNAGGTPLEGQTIAAGRVRVEVEVEAAFELR
jgi:uncharacterized protein